MSGRDIQPAVLGVGLLVIGGLFVFSSRKKRLCKNLPDIWTEEGPLHLTIEAQEDAFELSRNKIREHVIAGGIYKLSDIQMYVADGLRDCAWEKLSTNEQKQVWSGIGEIVNEVNQRAKQDPDAFLKSF